MIVCDNFGKIKNKRHLDSVVKFLLCILSIGKSFNLENDDLR